MFRQLLIVVLFLFMGTKLTASHYVGGEITYTTTGNGIYNITLTVYKDCGAFTAGFPSSVTVSMLNNLTGSSVAAVTLFPGNEIALPNSYSPACVSNLPTFCISKKVYTGTLYYSGTLTNGFTFTYGNCCRNYTISNIVSPGSTSMTYKTETFPAGVGIQNSTPTFIVNPPTIVAGGIPVTIPFAANDADGDSLYYEFTNALNGSITSPVTYASGYSGTTPLPSSPAATINGTTGLISANLNLQGQYVVAVAIYEYRNGLLLTKTQRDYQFNIAIVNGMSIALSNYQPIHCAGDSSGVLGVQVFNGTLPYNYSWSNGGSTAVINGIGSGTYSVVCEDAIGCKDSLEVTLNEPDSLLLNVSMVQASCKAVADGIINLNLTGGRAPYSYVVDAVTYPTSTITGLLAGSHQVVVRDSANLCTIDTTIIVPYDTNWNDVVVDSIFTPSCSYTADGQIQLDNTNGLNLNWLDNNSTSALRSNLNSGTYTVEVANSQGCKDSITAVVPARDSLFWNQFNTTIAACLSANNAQISFQATGGVAPYNYLLNNTTLPGTIADSLFAGTYTITLQDSVGCQIDSTVTIAADTNWNDVVVDSIFTPSCSYTADGQIQLDNTNGLNLNWLDNNSTSALRSNLNSGTYTVEVANSQGCKDSITAVVPARDSLFWNQFNTTIAACLSANNAQISFQATGGVAPYNYLLNNTTLPGTIADSLFAGTYTITLQDSVGCQIDSTVTIAADTNWNDVVVDSIFTPSCSYTADGQIQLDNTNGFNLNWLDNNSTSALRSNLNSGTYTVEVANSQGCKDSITAVVPARDSLFWNQFNTTIAACLSANNAQISFQATGGVAPYNYLLNNTTLPGTIADSLFAGTYTITLQDSVGCQIDSTVTIAADTNWNDVVVDSIFTPSCSYTADGQIQLDNTNGFNLNWLDNNSTSALRSNLNSGTYTVEVANSQGCKDSITAVVPARDSLFWNQFNTTIAACLSANNAQISFQATGGVAPYNYLLNNTTLPGTIADSLFAGTYTITLQDSVGCQIDSTVTIAADTNWNDVVVDSIFTPSCSYTADGQIQLDNTNGLNLNWLDNNSTSALRSNLNSGTYTVEVANSQGCKDSITAVVPARDSLFWNQFNTTIAACLSANNAQISFQATGGVAPYNYLLNNTTLPGTIADSLFAGTYTITLQDSVGCQIDSTVTIAADTNWNDVVVDSIFTPSCSYTADGQIQLDNTNGLNLNWLDNNSTSALRSNLNSGTYTVEVANSQGCKDSITAVVPARDSLFWNQFNTTIAACLSANNAQISFQATGGVAPYNYLLNNTTLPGTIADSLFAGTYTITLQDSVGCQIDSTVTIAADTNWYSLLLDTIISPSCFGLSDGKILFNSSGFDPNTTFGWLDKPLAGLNRDTLSAGTYTLFINNAGLCFDTLSFVVMEPDLLKIDSLFTMNTTCLTASDGEIAVFVSGGTQPYSYYVNGSAQTPPLNSFSTGTYNIEVSDTRGCTTDTTVNVGYYQNWYNIVLQNEISPLCYGDFTGEIILSTSDGNPPNVTWQWSDDPNANFSRTGLSSGTYVLTISDLSGCQDSMVVVLDEPDKIGFLPVVTEETCFGDKQGTIDLNPFGGTKPYSISWLGSSAVGSILTGTQVGTYYPTLIDNNGCVRSDTITVNGPDSLYFITNIRNPKTCSSFDGLIEMLPFGGFSPYSYYLNTAMTNAVTTGLGPGNYILEVQDYKNCSISENVSLTVIDRYALFIPNAFTPGNDNINEEFKIGGDPSCFTDVEFIIFNRWGQEVFRTEEPFTDFWNGQQSGKDSDQASFQYFFHSNERTEAGKILLIR